MTMVRIFGEVYGSSPRGRGKPDYQWRIFTPARLIPARAGKTVGSFPVAADARAHPRAGGENLIRAFRAVCTAGSSPRGRGKLCSWRTYKRHTRLIPARAGKTNCPADRLGNEPAHPRAGGENE